jgi:CheY-like chemotaxis protein
LCAPGGGATDGDAIGYGAMADTRQLSARKTVLVVEDDRSISDLMRSAVEDLGLRCIPASEGHVAVEMAREESPCLITLDLDLPDTDGHAVLHRLLADERTRAIPILVVTGYSHYLPPTDGARVIGVLDKPLDFERFESLLRSVTATDALR